MGDLRQELAVLNRVARPLEFSSDGTLIREWHPAVTAEVLKGQHAIRAWEYSMALRALESWIAGPPVIDGYGTAHLPHQQHPALVADIGGAGSNFYKTVLPRMQENGRVHVVDPELATPDDQRGIVHGLLDRHAIAVKYPLHEWALYKQNNSAYDVVFCLSVIEHVGSGPKDVSGVFGFLSDLRSLVRPGGLLFLTCDMGEKGPDTYHFHWMRKWIPTPAVLAGLVEEMCIHYGFRRLGAPADFEYRGPTVYDYTVASIALVRQ